MFKYTGLKSKILSLNFGSTTSLLGDLRPVIQPLCAFLSLSVKIGIVIVVTSCNHRENYEMIHIKSWHIINTNKWLTKMSYVNKSILGREKFWHLRKHMIRKEGGKYHTTLQGVM